MLTFIILYVILGLGIANLAYEISTRNEVISPFWLCVLIGIPLWPLGVLIASLVGLLALISDD